jgi:GNAT superfamily N-acetyltransferase
MNNGRTRMEFHPLTVGRWPDLEKLFGARGAYGGCWCMYWRLTRAEFARGQGDGNRRALKRIVESGRVPGILAYSGGEPVGWCSVAPREDYPSLERSPVLKRLDDKPVWSITCFYIARGHRGQGVTEALIRAAVAYVKRRAGKIVEAYPTRPRGRTLAPVSNYQGVPAMFKRVGFEECARPSAAKVVMRYYIGKR